MRTRIPSNTHNMMGMIPSEHFMYYNSDIAVLHV